MERKHEAALCEECPLLKNGAFVPTFNPHPRSKILVLGEAPGVYETVRGIPFTGPSGDLMNRVLEHHGLKRNDVMISNTTLCRPENNDDPPKKAIECCAPRLRKEIEESGVKQILAVGKVSTQATTGTKLTMRKARVGPPKPYIENSAIEVIPSWHPAYCLRVPDSFPDLVKDVGKIHGIQENQFRLPRYAVADDKAIAFRAIEHLKAFDHLVLDIECGVDKDVSYVHPSEYPLLCVGLAFAPGRAVVFGENAVNNGEVADALSRLLATKKIIAHNGKFDLAGLRNYVGRQTLWFDTMLASYCLDERGGHHGLKQLSIERLGAPDYEQEIREYIPRSGNYGDIPRSILYKYNAYDVVCTWDLFNLFNLQMDNDDRKKHDFLVMAANELIELELNGIHFDSEYNKELHEQFLDELAVIENDICNLVGREINPRSVQQVQVYYLSNGLDLPNTNADLLTELAEKISGEPREFTTLLLKHRRKAKLFGTYVKGLGKRVHFGKVYTTYLLHGTTSGRLASRGPNLQNVVRESYIRNQFTAEDDKHILIQLDYKQAEGRVIATLAKDEYLRDIFQNAERDIFTEICNDVFGVGRHGKEERVKVKSVFYGLAYGREAASIAKELDISLSESQKLLHDFRALIPGVMHWQAAIKHQVLSGDDLITPYGRRRSFWLITDKNKTEVLNEALSFLPQSIASDICLTALIRLRPKLEGLAKIRLTVHDAIIVECLKAYVDKVVEIMKHEMINAAKEFTDYVPFAVDVSIGRRWGDL